MFVVVLFSFLGRGDKLLKVIHSKRQREIYCELLIPRKMLVRSDVDIKSEIVFSSSRVHMPRLISEIYCEMAIV